MAITWTSFADASKDQYVGRTYPAAVRLSANKFVAFAANANADSKIVDYSTITNELSATQLANSSPPWTSLYNVDGFSICTLSDGRVLAAGGYFADDSSYHRESYIGTYTGSDFTWVATNDLPVDGNNLRLLLLSDNRILLARNGTYAPYFGTVSSNTITWVLGTGSIARYDYDAVVLLADGRVLIGGGDYHEAYTVSSNAVSSTAITDSGSPLVYSNPFETLTESGAAIFSCMRGPDARRAAISGDTLTHAALTSMGESTANEIAVFEGSDGAYIVLFLADSTEPLGLVGLESSATPSDFAISTGSSFDFITKVVAARAWETTQGADNYTFFVTDDRSFTLSTGSDVYFDAWGTINVTCGSTAGFVSADVHSVRFALASGSAVAMHGATIQTNVVRLQGKTKVDFIPSFEKQTAFQFSASSVALWSAVFQIPAEFTIESASTLLLRGRQHTQPVASINCGSAFVPHLSVFAQRAPSIATGSTANWLSDASNLARLNHSGGSECSFASASSYVDRQTFPVFAGCH